MRVTAIVVARGGSRRVPGKALRPFGDSTLIGHKVDQLKACAKIHEVVVGSDDDAILDEARDHGAEVRKRDAYHCDESVCSANEMIRNMAAMVECDVVVWAHPTNPLCMTKMYDDAVETFQNSRSPFDSLASVTRVQRHAWRNGKPDNFDPWGDRHPFASELDPVFYQNGAIFIQRHRDMVRNAYFYGTHPRLFEIEPPYDLDVDTECDLMFARSVYRGMREGVPCLS